MSQKDDCWDNAVAENFFKPLKTELIHGYKLISKEQMKLDSFDPSKRTGEAIHENLVQ